MADCDQDEIKTPFFSWRGKSRQTAELISMASMLALGWVGWQVWEMKAETKKDSTKLEQTFKQGFTDLAGGQKEQNEIMRFQLCLQSVSPERREREYISENSMCRQLSKEKL